MDCMAFWFEDSDQVIKNFRLNKEAVLDVLESIKGNLKSIKRSTALCPSLKLDVALKFLAEDGY